MSPLAPQPHAPLDISKMITFLVMVVGMFMAILDIQIVSASLPQIQAGLSASSDDIPWVQTSYLIAEVVMIPLSGTLSRILSTRWMFSISAAGFTLMSFMCATAADINQMIVYRALQGFIGGGMIPTVFATAFMIFPPERRNVVGPLIGLIATLAPTIGPTVGGYLTDYLSWHWLFLVNIVPGVLVTVISAVRIDFDHPNFALARNFDWYGFAFMALFLGSMEYVLEDGATNNWFEDKYIVDFTVLMTLGGIAFFVRVFTTDHPIVNMSAFTNRNFAVGSIFGFFLGVGLYGLTYLFPLFLARARGYSALQIGDTMFVTGLVQFIMAPIAGRLMSIMDARVMVTIGLVLMAACTFLVTGVTSEWDFWELFIPQILRGMGLMLCIVPINTISLGTMPPQKLKDASGLFNLLRNLGGAVGLAVINTVLSNRITMHTERLGEAITAGSGATSAALHNLGMVFHNLGPGAATAALAELDQIVTGQASVMAFADIFVLLTVISVAQIVLAPLVQKARAPAPGGGGGDGGH